MQMWATRQAERHALERRNPVIGSSTPERMQAATLRLIALSAQWLKADREQRPDDLQALAEQVMHQVLDAANLLRVPLDERVPVEVQRLTGEAFLDVTARMAKAAEALDHLEDYPSRKVFEQALVDLAAGLEGWSMNRQFFEIDLVAARAVSAGKSD